MLKIVVLLAVVSSAVSTCDEAAVTPSAAVFHRNHSETAKRTPVTTPTVAAVPPPAAPASSTTLPPVLDRTYRMYERSATVVELQEILGLRQVDGIYGPMTRAAHMSRIGGNMEALVRFYPNLGVDRTLYQTGPDDDSHEDPPTLADLIVRFFDQPDRRWAYRVAFCESSGQPHHTGSDKVSTALAVGWFQHLAKYWRERAIEAGWPGADPFDPEANVAVAAWLFYEGGGARHWKPSQHCWGDEGSNE